MLAAETQFVPADFHSPEALAAAMVSAGLLIQDDVPANRELLVSVATSFRQEMSDYAERYLRGAFADLATSTVVTRANLVEFLRFFVSLQTRLRRPLTRLHPDRRWGATNSCRRDPFETFENYVRAGAALGGAGGIYLMVRAVMRDPRLWHGSTNQMRVIVEGTAMAGLGIIVGGVVVAIGAIVLFFLLTLATDGKDKVDDKAIDGISRELSKLARTDAGFHHSEVDFERMRRIVAAGTLWTLARRLRHYLAGVSGR